MYPRDLVFVLTFSHFIIKYKVGKRREDIELNRGFNVVKWSFCKFKSMVIIYLSTYSLIHWLREHLWSTCLSQTSHWKWIDMLSILWFQLLVVLGICHSFPSLSIFFLVFCWAVWASLLLCLFKQCGWSEEQFLRIPRTLRRNSALSLWYLLSNLSSEFPQHFQNESYNCVLSYIESLISLIYL